MTSYIKRHIGAILAAASFLTRMPIPQWVGRNSQAIAQASRWFSFVGLMIGIVAAIILYSLSLLMGQYLAVVLTLTIIMLFTGAFHEDGLADLCDGFGGGWQTERKLAIMKDSQIGTYGVLALVVTFSVKLITLMQMPLMLACSSLVICHAGSRALAGLVAVFLPYARHDTNNKTPQKDTPLPIINRFILLFFGAIPLQLLPVGTALTLIGIWLLTFIYLIKLMESNIQGYTGDTLGASQQIIEIMGLIFLTVYHFQVTSL